MATIYVRSSDGSNTDDGSTWALAKATLAGASAIDAAGDLIAVASGHSETPATGAVACSGTSANPTRIISVNDGAAPPTTEAAGASVRSVGTLTITGSCFVKGLHLASGNGQSSNFNLVLHSASTASDHIQTYEDCTLGIDTTGSTSVIQCGVNVSNSDSTTVLINCKLDFSNSGQGIRVYGKAWMRGLSKLSGSSNPSSLFDTVGSADIGGDLLVEGSDLSGFSSTLVLVETIRPYNRARFRNCLLPSGWNPGNVANTLNVGARVDVSNCRAGSILYRLVCEDYSGFMIDENTIARSGGANDGSSFSWKMISNAACNPWGVHLRSEEIVQRVDGIGSPLTFDIEILTDGVTLNNDDIWLEAEYLGASGSSLSSHVSTRKAPLAAAAAVPSSSATWTTTGLDTPVKQKLSITITPLTAGTLHLVVKLGKPSTTVFVCPG